MEGVSKNSLKLSCGTSLFMIDSEAVDYIKSAHFLSLPSTHQFSIKSKFDICHSFCYQDTRSFISLSLCIVYPQSKYFSYYSVGFCSVCYCCNLSNINAGLPNLRTLTQIGKHWQVLFDVVVFKQFCKKLYRFFRNQSNNEPIPPLLR